MKVINVGNRIVNNYVVCLDNGYLLIDTGYYGQFKSFCKRLDRHGIKLEEISYVFLTHTHDDHVGFLNELLNHTDAKVILHPSAVKRLMGGTSHEGGCTSRLALASFGFMKLIGNGEHKFPTVDRNERYLLLDECSKPILEKQLSGTIIHLPGHSEDSIGLLCEEGLLFCGDAAMNGFPSKKRISIWVENLNAYRESWKAMMHLGNVKVYPGHGKPFIIEELKKNYHKITDIKLYPLP